MRRRWLGRTSWGLALLMVAACGGGGGEGPGVTAPPVQPPAVALLMTKTDGDGQSAAPGSTVPASPEVQVINDQGRAMIGTWVSFEIVAGGGRVQAPQARTDVNGLVNCGSWTLGPGIGINTLRASVAGLDPVSFTAKAVRQAAEVSLNLQKPLDGQPVNDPLTVTATVVSSHALAGVTAASGGRSVDLAYGPYGSQAENAWSGILSLAGQARGMVEVVVTATDVLGHASDAVTRATLDRPPVLHVSSPLEGEIARPDIQLAVTCSDDDEAGCIAIRVGVAGGAELVAGSQALAQPLDLSAYEGQSIYINIVGIDSVGRSSTVMRKLSIESSPLLTVHQVLDGPVWDVSGTRILFVDLSGAVPALKILDSETQATQTLETDADLVGTMGGYGLLTPGGALFVHGSRSHNVYPYAWLYEWRSGVLTQLSGIFSPSLRTAGDWAIYNLASELWQRDLAAGVSTRITDSDGCWMNAVAANGDVVFCDSRFDIVRWRDGSLQALTARTIEDPMNNDPVTDGMNVVYQASRTLPQQTYQIVLDDGTQARQISPPTTVEPAPGSDYAVAGGHVAYAAEDAAGTLQVWRLGPAGAEQLTFFGSASRIDALLPDGSVLLTQQNTRWRARPGQALQAIGSGLGRVVVRDGQAWVIIDRTVMALSP